MSKIYPSILSADFSKLGQEILDIQAAGADGIHVDVMDGKFVPNLSFGAPVLAKISHLAKIPLDCHLMVEDPDILIDDFVKAGATTITVHKEACRHLQKTLSYIRSQGVKAGVAINPATDYHDLEWILPDIDLVLSMTVNPGFGGQKLIPGALKKTQNLIAWLDSKGFGQKIEVEIDGGVNPSTAPDARKIGVDILVAGSAVFSQPDYKKAIEDLRR